MPRKRKMYSRTLERAALRAAKMQAISPELDFGEGLNLNGLNRRIKVLQAKQISYNVAIEEVDRVKAELLELEKELADFCDRMLTGVATRFGKNSNEYALAGGVRKDERQRRGSAKPAVEPAAAATAT